MTAQRRDPSRIVFAERTKRSESTIFVIFYSLYKWLHFLLIGRGVQVSNFSVVPLRRLESLVVVSELWNYYAASAFKSRQPLTTIPTVRGKRLQGRSTMNFVSLGDSRPQCDLGLFRDRWRPSPDPEPTDEPCCVAGLIAVAYIRIFTSLSIPGWATSAIGLLSILLLQTLSLSAFFIFVMLASCNSSTILPEARLRFLHQPDRDHRAHFMTNAYTYVGSELELFAAALHWKSYVRCQIAPYLDGDVLEVGAGLGGTTKAYCPAGPARWVCLEPDVSLASRLSDSVRNGELPTRCRVEVGTLEARPKDDPFDTLLYIDVLEHIEEDRAEMARAAPHLRPGGVVVALSPAHQSLFTPFDTSVGHYRRYSLATLRR